MKGSRGQWVYEEYSKENVCEGNASERCHKKADDDRTILCNILSPYVMLTYLSTDSASVLQAPVWCIIVPIKLKRVVSCTYYNLTQRIE